MELSKTKQEVIQHYNLKISMDEMQEILDVARVRINVRYPFDVNRRPEVLRTIVSYFDISKSEIIHDMGFCSTGIKFSTKRTF